MATYPFQIPIPAHRERKFQLIGGNRVKFEGVHAVIHSNSLHCGYILLQWVSPGNGECFEWLVRCSLSRKAVTHT